MDLCADMLLAHLPVVEPSWTVADVCPPFRARFRWHNADRIVNRLWHYPRHARRIAGGFDFYHVVDHSYSQLVHALSPGRTGVFCQDLDTFRCLFDPAAEPRPRWFRAMARNILAGLTEAAVVFHSSLDVGRQIVRRGLADPARLVHAPHGVAPEFTAEGDVAAGPPYLLHVGSCIPRKRIDVLLDAFAATRKGRDLRLVQVGGEWTAAQAAEIDRLGIASAVEQRRGLSRGELAALYRGAALVLQPSEAEGFGLPVVEALACGAAVVASDIPVLREVGGDAATYCPVGDVPAWTATVNRLLDHPDESPSRDVRLAWAARFTWAAQARTIAAAYRNLLATGHLAACASPS